MGFDQSDKTVLEVIGQSMFPVLQEKDLLFVAVEKQYQPGDILVYMYKNVLTVHRILFVKNSVFYCKGDNSFRLEDVCSENVIGKVVYLKRNGRMIVPPKVEQSFLDDSFLISRIFRKKGYDITETKKTIEYQNYYNNYLRT